MRSQSRTRLGDFHFSLVVEETRFWAEVICSFSSFITGRTGLYQIDVFTCCCCCWVASVMSDSVRPPRQQPTRLPCPWDSPGKNTGVGCHFLLQCMKVKSESEVTQSCPTLCDPMDGSPPGSSGHGIFQARLLEWGTIAFSFHLQSLKRKIGWRGGVLRPVLGRNEDVALFQLVSLGIWLNSNNFPASQANKVTTIKA